MPEEEDPQDAEGMKRSLRQMGIRPHALSTPKRIETLSWLNRIEFHFEVTKCPAEDKTRSLLFLLDVECFEIAKHFGLKSKTDFDAKAKLKIILPLLRNQRNLESGLTSDVRKRAKASSRSLATSS